MGLKNGYFFTMDAALAASVLLGGILLLSAYHFSDPPVVTLDLLSQDIIDSLASLRIYELDNEYVDELVSDEEITDINNSVLDQVGEFWADDRLDIAYLFLANVTDGLLPDNYGFGLWINGGLVFQRSGSSVSTRASAKRLVSGVDKAVPIDGFIAKARANSYLRSSSLVIPFSPEGSGWDGTNFNPGKAIVDKYFELPDDIIFLNSTLWVSLHIEEGGSDWTVIDINDGLCTIDRDDINFLDGEGTFDRIDIDGCLVNGENHVQLDLRNIGYHAHTHPGMLIEVDYEQDLFFSNESVSDHFSERIYFDDVQSFEGSDSKSGAWQLLPFYIPEGAENVSVNMHIKGRHILDYSGTGSFSSWSGSRNKRDYDYILFVNDDEPFDSDNHPGSSPVYDYNSSELADVLVSGTNVVTVYFNCYYDSEWGGGQPEIYSDPFDDPDNSSYVEVSYDLPGSVPYGHIEITRIEEFGGLPDDVKDVSFSFPESAHSISEVFVHIVQQYSDMLDVFADTSFPPSYTVFSSPSGRAVPTTVYIPKDVLDVSSLAVNYVRIDDDSSNDILPNSSLEYSFFVPSFVGYGDVFSTQSEADDDALDRLNQTLGDFVSSDDLVVETGEMSGVPSLWGPAVVEVRVWH